MCHVLTWLAEHAHGDVALLVREQRAWLGLGPEATHGCKGSGEEAGCVFAGEQALCGWEEVVDDALVHLQDKASKQGSTGQSVECNQVCGLQTGDDFCRGWEASQRHMPLKARSASSVPVCSNAFIRSCCPA